MAMRYQSIQEIWNLEFVNQPIPEQILGATQHLLWM